MVELHELLAVAYKKERLRSRRLVRHAGLSELAALVRTLEEAAAEQSLRDLVDARRAAQAKAADALRLRQLERATRTKRRTAFDDSSAGESDAWIGWFDGSALPNPGRIGIGGVLKAPHGERIEISATAGIGDSSLAEYLALLALLEAAVRNGAARLVIYGDSRVVIDDVAAPASAGIRRLADHAERVRTLIARIGDVRLQWIPRARNADADRLSRQALGLPALRAA
jgi:ribonuclease HI